MCSCSLDLADDLLAARGCLYQLGLDASLARVSSLLRLIHQMLELLLDLRVVGAGLLSRIGTLRGSTIEFLLDLRLLRVHSLLLVLDLRVHLGQSHLVVRLSAGLDRVQKLGLTLLSTGQLLLEGALDALAASTILRITALADELDLVVVVASALLDLGQLAIALSLSRRVLLS